MWPSTYWFIHILFTLTNIHPYVQVLFISNMKAQALSHKVCKRKYRLLKFSEWALNNSFPFINCSICQTISGFPQLSKPACWLGILDCAGCHWLERLSLSITSEAQHLGWHMHIYKNGKAAALRSCVCFFMTINLMSLGYDMFSNFADRMLIERCVQAYFQRKLGGK